VTASQRLREATAERHRRLERSRFARALSEKSVGRQQYAEYLQALSVVLSTFVGEVQRCGTPRERDLVQGMATWPRLLQDDLEALGAALSPVNEVAQSAALELAGEVRTQVGTGSAYLAGVAYVLVGSHRGNVRLAPGVSLALGLEGQAGTRYLRATEGAGDEPWEGFRARLDALLPSEGDVAQATQGALETFEAFAVLFGGLASSAPPVHHVTSLNPEAGDVPIPQDPALLELSNEVADRAMDDFPYLRFRFGERGDRFARSDGAWLVTLAGLPVREAQRQIAWLSRVLSSRGIPTICLEHHLLLLHQALGEPGAPHVPDADLLGQLARELADRRLDTLGGARLGTIAPPEEPLLGTNLGDVLRSAVADQLAGVAPCADEIRAWAEREPRLDGAIKRQLAAFLEAALPAAKP